MRLEHGNTAGSNGPSAALLFGERRVGTGSGGLLVRSRRWRGGCAGVVVDVGGSGLGFVRLFVEAVSKRWLSGHRQAQAHAEVRRGIAGGRGRGQEEDDDGAGGRGGGLAPGAWAVGERSVLRRTDGSMDTGALSLWDGFVRCCGGFQGAGAAGFGGWRWSCLRGCAWGLRGDGDDVEVGTAKGWVLGVAEAGEFCGRGCGG